MFWLWKKAIGKGDVLSAEVDESEDEKEEQQEQQEKSVTVASGLTAATSAQNSLQEAAQKFAKPAKYDRQLYDSGIAKRNIKQKEFQGGGKVYDPYTGDELVLKKAEAKMQYGEDWQRHLAEADHINPLKTQFEKLKNKPWITNEDIKSALNDEENLQLISRKVNNAKRARTNEELVGDEKYQQDKDLRITEQGKKNALADQKSSGRAIQKSTFKSSVGNAVKTGHNAGIQAAKNAGATGATMAGIMNITAVIKGEKTADEAIADTVISGGKAAATGYVMGGGVTVIQHTLSSSSSKFLQALSQSNVPGKVITAITVTGGTLMRYANGEISTQECMIELGESGLNVLTTGYAMAAGQALIPIPIVGAAVGALVGSALTSAYYQRLVAELRQKQLEHEERMRITAECERAKQEMQAFRQELERYLQSYFRDYQHCFDEALSTLDTAFQMWDVNGIISSANRITEKMGGKVCYNNMDEFMDFITDGKTDVF